MKRITAALLVMIMLLTSGMTVSAWAQTVKQDALSITLTTDKEAYAKGEKIQATLTVENQSGTAVEDVMVDWKTPQLCAADKNARTMRSAARIADGASKTVEMTFTVTGNPGKLDGEEGEDPAELLPQTGDGSNMLLWAALLALSVFALSKLDPRSRKRLTALVLCCALSMSMLPLGAVSSAKAQDKEACVVTVEEEIRVMGRKVKLAAKVSYVPAEAPEAEDPDQGSALLDEELTGYGLSATSVMLDWAEAENADGYEIHRSLKKTSGYKKILDTAETSAQAPATKAKLNYFKVRAYTDAEDGTRTYSSFTDPLGIYPLARVTGLKAALDGSGRVVLTWKAVTNAKKYEIYYSNSENGEYALYGAVTGKKVVLTDLPSDLQEIYLKVVATRTDSKITSRSADSAVLPYFISKAPTNVTGLPAGSGKLQVSWTAAPNAEGYEVYACATKTGTYKKYATTAETQAEISVADKPIWYVKVRSYVQRDGKTLYSNYTQPYAVYRLAKPGSLKAALNTSDGVTLTWKKVTNALKYEIEYSEQAEGPYTLHSSVKTLKATLNNLPQEMTQAYFRVTAVREAGSTVFKSEPAQAAFQIVRKPANVTAAGVSASKVKLSWEAVKDAEGYEVYASTSKTKSFKKKASTTELTAEAAATKSKVNYFKVRAYATVSGKKVYGNYSSVLAVYPLAVPADLSATTTDAGFVQLKWKKVSNAKKYNIFYSDEENGEYTKLMSVTGTSAVLEALPDTLGVVYLRVSAERTDKGVVSASEMSSALQVLYGTNKDDFDYAIADGKVTINGYKGDSTNVILPEKIDEYPVTAIGANAFAGYTAMTAVKIPESVVSIGAGAFSGCTGLTSVIVPGGVTVIEDDTFNGCTSLASAQLPNAVTKIGKRAFKGCTSLSSMVSK